VFLCPCQRTGAFNRVTLYSLVVSVRTVCVYRVWCVWYVTVWLHPVTCEVSVTVVRRGDRFCQNYTVSDFMKPVQKASIGYGRTHRRTQRTCFYNCLLKTRQKFKKIVPLLHLCCVSVTSCRLASHIKSTVNYSTWNHTRGPRRSANLNSGVQWPAVSVTTHDDAECDVRQWPSALTEVPLVAYHTCTTLQSTQYTDNSLCFCSRFHSSFQQY